jgi:hypothetical protein
MSLLTLVSLRSGAAEVQPARGEPPGSDVFVMVREALLRDKPSRESRFVAKLPGGSRLKLLEAGDAYLKVEVGAATPADSASTGSTAPDRMRPRASAAIGFLSRDVASIFPPGASGTADLVASGRVLAASESHRRIAAGFLLRASERLRDEGKGTGDAAVEVLLGETAESLAKAGGPFPPGLEVVAAPLPGIREKQRWTYTGDAFRRAIAWTAKSDTDGNGSAGVRDRARAGALRQLYPETSPALAALWQETASWLELVETAEDPSAVRASADRLGSSSLALGRFLLAAQRPDDLDKLERRVRAAGERVRSLLPGESSGGRLLSRAQILRTLRGNGSAPFPQEARIRLGPKEIVARIEGKLGALSLVAEATVGGTHSGPLKKNAVPVLPVPGSFRLSPDGKTAAWIEAVSPSKLVPVVASLEKDEPAREIAFLSNGRPFRDQGLAHVISSVSGWSKDGQRLGVSIQAWNDTPGPEARFSVVAVATGELLFETSKDLKSFQRLIQ